MKVADRRSVPEATTAPEQLAFKTAESASGQLLAIEDAEGIVTAIVSVTGTVDEVDDVILPGAYGETLTKRRPKVCWAHSWEHPIGRVLHIEELMPGDDRLPAKTKDGQPWPREAGALVATMQFNMRTDEGKNAFEAVRFYSETGECEYSIGYQVPPGMASKAQGVRYIKMLELYELSVVLFGAHTMTGTISIKEALAVITERKAQRGQTGTVARDPRSAKDVLAAIREGKAGIDGVSRRAGTGEVGGIDGKADGEGDGTVEPPKAPKAKPKESEPDDLKPTDAPKPDHSDGVMVAVYPDPAAADALASHIAGPDETLPKEELHVTLAFLGTVNDLTMTSDEVFKRVSEALEGEAGLRGTVGGIGLFPPSEGSEGREVTWVPVDVPGLTLLRETVVEALGDVVATDHGFTPHITLGYDLGVIDPVPAVPVEFTEVRVVYGEQARNITLGSIEDPDAPEGLPWERGEKGAVVDDLDSLSISDVVRLTAIESLTHGDVGLTEGKAGGADRNRGEAEQLRRYWTTGAGGAKIAWGTSGDFTRCAKLLSEHMAPERAKGYCANRHKEMTGMWPGDRDNKTAEYDPTLERKEAVPAPAGKGFPHMPGSFEERQAAVHEAVTEALRGEPVNEEGDRYEWDHVSIDATFEDRLIATRIKWDGGADERETFEMGYTFTEYGVDLTEPDPVTLQVVAVDADGVEEDVPVGDVMPFDEDLLAFAARFKAAHGSAMETKAGRVLSGANERKLRDAVENLVNVLAAAGLNVALVEATEEDQPGSTPGTKPPKKRDERKPIDPAVDMSTTSPSAATKELVVEEQGDVVILDAEAVQARIAALTAD